MPSLAPLIATSLVLTELNLSSTLLDSKPLNTSRSFPDLSRSLPDNQISVEGLSPLASALETNTSLTSLDLQSKSSFRFQNNLFSLTSLTLATLRAANPLGDEGVGALSRSLLKNRHLEKLSLYRKSPRLFAPS